MFDDEASEGTDESLRHPDSNESSEEADSEDELDIERESRILDAQQ